MRVFRLLRKFSKAGLLVRIGRFVHHKKQEDHMLWFGPRWHSSRQTKAVAEGSVVRALRNVARQAGPGRTPVAGCTFNFSCRFKSVGVTFCLAILDAQSRRAFGTKPGAPGVRSFTSGDELPDLGKEGNLEAAMDCADQRRTAPSVYVCRSLLKACAKRKVLTQTQRLQSCLTRHGLAFTRSLGEHLVSALVKCGGLEEAVEVFDKLACKSNFSWNAIITGYAALGQGALALIMYQRMRDVDLEPDKHTFVSLLKACGSLSDLKEGKRIHEEAIKYGYAADLYVVTSLVYMYGKCGSIVDAQSVFDGVCQRNVVLWTAMLAAYAQQGQAENALHLYLQMREGGISPDARSILTALQACGMLAEQEQGVDMDGECTKIKSLVCAKEIHFEAQSKGYTSNVFLGNTLVTVYGKCGSISDARVVFDRLSFRDVVSWTAMLAACVQRGQAENALTLYEHMLKEGTSPNDVTFVSVLQAYGLLAERDNDVVDGQRTKYSCLQKGKVVHAELLRKAHTSLVPVANSLVSMYSKCGSIMDAHYVFEATPQRNAVSWTAMLTAYAQQGQAEEAVKLYQQMKEEGVSPDHVTFVSVLQACGMLTEKEGSSLVNGQSFKVKSLEMGKVVHADAGRKGYDLDVVVGNTLITMYGKCGSLADAYHVFEGLSYPDVVSWTAIVGAHAQQSQAESVFQLYRLMREAGVNPNEVTLVCILQACSDVGSLDMCRQIHRTLVSAESNLIPLVATSLIHAYARCASMADARTVFDSVLVPDVVAWTALIAGYAREGNFSASLQCYEQMLVAGVKPNGVTFLSLLSACSHAGLVDRGVDYFQSMSRDHGLKPEIEHYVCMVDLLGRAGYFNSVEDLLSSMPQQPNLSIWLSLLSACRKYGKLLLGRHAFEKAVALEPRTAAAYLLMSNIYSHAGLSGSADEVSALERKADMWRTPAKSWIEIGRVHFFVVKDLKHPHLEQTYEFLGKVTAELTLEGRTA